MSNTGEAMIDNESLGWGDDDPVDIEAAEQYDELYGERGNGFTQTKGAEGWEPNGKWALNGYIPTEGLTVIKGDTCSLKSFAALDFACCIASGKQWIDRRVKQGAVVYVSPDGANGLRKRAKGWADAYNDGDDIDDLLLVGKPINFKDAVKTDEFIKEIKSTCGAHGAVVLVVIDSIERCIGGYNDGYVVRACDRIMLLTGAAVMVVKNSKSAQGGDSYLNAACDSEISIKRVGKFGYELTNTKQRDGKLMPGMEIRMEERDLVVVDEDGEAITTLVRCGGETMQPDNQHSDNGPIYDTIHNHHLSTPLTGSRWFTASELCAWHGEKPSMSRRWGMALTKLQSEGRIEVKLLSAGRKEYKLPVRNASSSNVKEDK